MTLIVIAVVFTVLWGAVTGSFSLLNLAFGFMLSILALYLVREDLKPQNIRIRPLKLLRLALLFFKELALSAWTVARIVLTPNVRLTRGILAFPLTVTRDFEITLLANLITLTPGTLSVDVSEDRRFLYVHAIDLSDPDKTIRAIAEGFETRILEAFR